jgi:hypothetical protein
MDYVIEIEAIGGPCWVATGGGDPERTHNIDAAEVYATEREAMDNAWAFRAKYPTRKFVVRQKPPIA